uniref:Uncharacterized protein n=1 Tax=Arundo donax TaxID=35708 RepID=A0A0A9EPI2_ARUDO
MSARFQTMRSFPPSTHRHITHLAETEHVYRAFNLVVPECSQETVQRHHVDVGPGRNSIKEPMADGWIKR